MTEQQNTNINTGRKRNPFLLLAIIVTVTTTTIIGYLGLDLVIDKINTSTTKTEETLIAIKQLQTKYNQLQNNLLDLQKEIQKSNITKVKYWKPLVIEHLIHMADLTLNTTGNTKLALSFLSEAKQYAGDSELSAINYALNKDIANLQVVPIIDDSELILKIETISQKIGSLPMVTPQFAGLQKKKIEESSKIKTLWQRFFTSTVDALKDIVIIRHKTADILLSPEQETILRLEIQTKLLQSQLAVMHRQNKLYQSCLEQTSNLITRYFAANPYAATDILPLLQELQSVDLEPKLSFPTEAIAAVTNFISANKLPDELPPQPQITPQKEGVQLL